MPTIWALPNYDGELYTADSTNTPILSMAGGLTGGKKTENPEFPVSSDYNLPAAAQPAIDETASMTAPAATNVARTQQTNVVQIHQYAIQLSYHKMASRGRLSGLNTAGAQNNVQDELDFQIARTLEMAARDVEVSFISGTYALAANAGQPNQTRGLLAACAQAGGTNINGAGAQLSLPIMQNLFLTMYNNGAPFVNPVIVVGGALKQRISSIYGFAPTDRNVGGVNVKQLETDFGNVGIVVSRFVPAGTVLVAEMSQIAPVFLEVPEKGVFFYEELAKTGAAISGQVYGEVGLDYGSWYAHGALTNVIA